MSISTYFVGFLMLDHSTKKYREHKQMTHNVCTQVIWIQYMPLCASTGPVLGRRCQHRTSTGPVLATNGMFGS